MHTDLLYDEHDDAGHMMWEGVVDYDSILEDERNYFADSLDTDSDPWDDVLTNGEGEDEW